MTNALIVRQEPGGKFCVGVFLLDTFCMGIKECWGLVHLTEDEVEELREMLFEGSGLNCDEVDHTTFHNLVYACLDYAEDIGLKPHPDFAWASKMLTEELVDEKIDDVPVGGPDDRPRYIPGTLEKPYQVIHALNKGIGSANYDIQLPSGDVVPGDELSAGELQQILEEYKKRDGYYIGDDYDEDDDLDEGEKKDKDKFDDYEEVK